MDTLDNPINRACPVCDETKAGPYLSKLNFHLVHCPRCSMLYTNPVPAEMATGIFYDRAGGEYLSPEKLESDYANVRFERELRLFRTYCRSGLVLDVGCSSGAFLYQLKKRFPNDYKILGTDVSQEPLDHAAKMGVPIVRGEFLKQTFEEKFDAVTFWAVMEHLAEPKKFLQKAASILKPGGHCFILTPNMDSLAVRLIGAKYRYIFAEHLNYFTPQTMKTFAGAEFSVVGMKSTHFNPLVIWQDFRGGEREISRADRIKLLKRTTGYKQSKWMRPVKAGYRAAEAVLSSLRMADNIAVVGRKL
ncbi:MAG TPA: class I SAM-dependent methyltransferase [Verrucomicrobiae bacterium]|nr:class I SAM-dependent methyltransferase [Verrucomicrobiae bacterium]